MSALAIVSPPPNDRYAAALEYASLGWRVLPVNGVIDGRCECGKADCASIGKHPCVKKWTEEATTDPAKLRTWFNKSPNRNLGIATGPASGIFVLDIDPRHGGDTSLEVLKQNCGTTWPDTLSALTGGGGIHFYFRYPDRFVKSNKNVMPGIDVRGEGGQVVAPPSRNGVGLYRWSTPEGTAKPVLAAPPFLLDLLAFNDKEAAPRKSFVMPGSINEGSRNDTLYKFGCSKRAKGAGDAEILAALLAENAASCNPPLAESEVRGIAKSVCEHPPGQSGGHRDTGSRKTLADLNGLAYLVDHGLAFTRLEMGSEQFYAYTTTGKRIIFPTMADLVQFRRAQQVIVKYTRILLKSPAPGKVTKTWEEVVDLMVKLAKETGSSDAGGDVQDLLTMCFERAGCPRPETPRELGPLLLQVKTWNREHADPSPKPAPFVFIHAGKCFVNAFCLRMWASLPRVAYYNGKRGDIIRELEELGFVFRRRHFDLYYNDERIQMDVWMGPPEVLATALEGKAADGEDGGDGE